MFDITAHSKHMPLFCQLGIEVDRYHLFVPMSLCVFCAQVLIYQVGFLVCVAIGVLYIVLMPLVGFFLACCRCCGNCGGKMYQKQTSSTDCRRRTLYWGAFITTVIIL